MEKYVITIARQFGSMGRPIAKRMAEELGIHYYDRDIVEKTAEKMGLPVSVISEHEEKTKHPFYRMQFPLGRDTIDTQEDIFRTQKEIILELAEKSSCIVVGRCSDYILQHFPNRMSVYIYASYESRLKNCINLLHMQQTEAERMITEVDRARELYHKRFAGCSQEDLRMKNIMIDSGILGAENTARALCEIIRMKY